MLTTPDVNFGDTNYYHDTKSNYAYPKENACHGKENYVAIKKICDVSKDSYVIFDDKNHVTTPEECASLRYFYVIL